MADFDETTTDPVALMALFNELEQAGHATPASPAEPAAAPAAAPVPDQAAAAPAPADATATPSAAETTAAAPAAAEPDPEGVATKDGKHIIPYSVLQSEREARTKAEQQAAELQKRVDAAEAAARAALEPGVTPGTATPASKAAPAADDLTDEELEVLKEDFPIVYKGLMATRAAADRLAEQMKPVEKSVQITDDERREQLRRESQDAIDATPKLAHVKATSPELFEQAKVFDNMLLAQDAWKGKPLAERYAKVVDMLEAYGGQISIPGAAPAAPAPTPEALRQQAQATAAAAAAKVANAGHVPTSLSSLPAGQPVATSEREAAETMTAGQLYSKMAGMSAAQLDKFMSEI